MILRKFKYLYFLLPLLIFLIPISSCKYQKPKPNIILIVPDALRAKQLPSYGYNHIKTPHLDRLIEESVFFKSAFVRSPWTTVSFSCLFSGLLFPSFGLFHEEKPLAQLLKEEGYYTVGAVSSHVLWSYESRNVNKFDKGFDKYIQDAQLKKQPFFRKNEHTTRDVLRELENIKNKQKPFFLFVHYMDPHFPYNPSYDREIEKIDSELGKIAEKLKTLKLYDHSLIIFTSDHGESLGDREEDHGIPRGHGWSLHTEQIHVPLIIKFPHSRYVKSIDQIVRNMDLMPTVLDYIGIPYNRDSFDGRSLLPTIKKDKELGLVSIHLGQSHRVCPEGSVAIVFKHGNDKFHFIRGKYSGRNQELYNISKDPDERKNLIRDSEFSEIKAAAEKMLDKFIVRIKESEEQEGELKKLEIQDQERLRALKALGYVGGGAPTPTIWKLGFLIQQKVPSLGQLKYFCTIRQPHWGIKKEDKCYPLKIIPQNDKQVIIIANENRELFEYHFKDGFRSMGLQNILDMAVHPETGKTYLLKRDGIFTLDRNKQTINPWENTGLHTLWPVRAIYMGPLGNLYLFRETNMTKLNGNGSKIKTYDFNPKNSSLFCVDHKEDMYMAEKNTILKYDKNGKKIRSFSIKSDSTGISSIYMDKKEKVWALEENDPKIHIFDSKGEELSSFTYNQYQSSRLGRNWTPVPTKQLCFRDKLFVIDDWEAILVYSLN